MEKGSFEVKVGLAEMLKGGVIMDVTNAEQAKIAEDAGAGSVMALERIPADIRADGCLLHAASGARRDGERLEQYRNQRAVEYPVLSLNHLFLTTFYFDQNYLEKTYIHFLSIKIGYFTLIYLQKK